ncbi:LOW QUALITY PROTEIN: 182 kDa tankyrase-1-binding protein [Strix uralensis]|uniref:LOW QUALITY PROTEIN: 182 kDa tankyrase-1-binding protein n=1 Tax=Strix uralensis TaxID=36305 RepID=UPI003DA45D7F
MGCCGEGADLAPCLPSPGPAFTMASQPQPLRPTLPSAGGAGLAAGSPEKGTARPKPPIRPKPRVLPKPAVPAKPSLPHTPPGPRHPRPELPSAEKMNRLAGPQPYGRGSVGGPLRRPSFTLKSPETHNGKGLSSPLVAATEDLGLPPGEEVPPAPPTPSRKGPAPFKVTPVPVATKPERFPGTTVEEILAKMDSREGPGSPDRARLSPFCPDPSSRFGSKTFTAFRRRPSGEADAAPPSETRQAPQPVADKLGVEDDGCPVAETSGSPPAGPSCAGDPRGRRRPPSPRDLSSLQPGALGPPGSPRPPACPAPAPGAPFQPAEPSASAPGSPDAPPELPAPGSPESPASPAPPPAEVSAASIQAPGAPSSSSSSSFAEPRPSASRSPGSPHTPGEGSPDTVSPPGTPELPPRVTCPPGSPEAAPEYPGPPSPAPEPPAKASRPPGSPEGPDDSPVSPQSPEGPDFSPPPPSRDSGLRRSSEGVLQPPPTGQGLGELGGSLSALPRPGDPLSEPSLGSESGWSLSQSFEWTFPLRGARRLASPPRSPIREAADSGLSEEGESDQEDPSPSPLCSRGDSGSEGVASSQEAEGAPCPGGPVAQREAEEEEEEEEEAERDAALPRSPLCVMEPEPPAQPGLPTEEDPAGSAWAPAGNRPTSLQGPGGPGHSEVSSRGPDPHADPGWLTELLASPGAHAAGHASPGTEGPEDLLGWSRKDLCSEFGIGHPPQAGAFNWTREAAPRERDWPGETERDCEFGTKSTWDGAHGVRDGDRQDRPFSTAGRDWGSDYEGTELTGEMRLGRGDWPAPPGTGESCRQDRDFGAGKPKWGTSYGLGGAGGEELSAGEADWSGGYGVGHGQRRDKGPGSGRLSWAGGYGTGNVQGKDGELSPDWASKYSSGDAETKEKDFTLGWAGRSSTGDTGSPEKDFSPSRAAWDSSYSPRDMESQDREFSPSRPAWDDGFSARDEPHDGEFSPSRPVWTGEYSARDMESQDREFSPSRPAWASDYHSRAMESQDREFSPVRAAEASKYGTGDGESRDGEFSPSRVAWDDGYGTRDGETQEREFSPGRAAWAGEYSSTNAHKEDGEFSPAQLSWAGERGLGQTELADAFGVREDDPPGPRGPDTPAQEPSWGSTDRREHSATESRDWAGELGGAQRHNQFGTIGTERAPDPCSAVAATDGSAAWAGMRRPLRDWPGDLSFSSPEATGWGPGLGNLPAVGNLGQAPEARLGEPGWSTELRDAEAKRREWASAFGARCAARSRDCGDGEQSLGGDGSSADGTIRLSAPSPLTGNAVEPPQSEPPSPAEEERDPPEPAAALPSPGASLLPPEAAGGTLLDTGSEGAPSEHPDGGRPPSWEEERLSLDAPQPEGPLDGAGQEFTFLEDTEVLDSSVYRCKANLGRKRRHRAPALRRDAASEGDSWIFRDSTEPRPACPAASSDEETVEEPKSRRVRASPSGKGVKVPLFPGLNASALKAKLRVRNRSAEEGAAPGDTKAAPPKDPHVQRSKSCKIPGSSGKPLVLPPKPEKSSGPDASPPHWLQALKLKKKKP